MAAKPIPEGYHAVTPYLVVDGADRLLEFVKEAFGAEETVRMPAPDGRLGHAEARIGDSVVMMGDAGSGEMEPTRAMIHLYVDDVDATYQRALDAGATEMRAVEDQFYGDRSGGVTDEFGNVWWIATHVEDVPEDELARRAEQLAQQQS